MEYSTFNYVQDRKLRAYNRTVTFFSIFGRTSKDTAQKYISAFDDEGKKDIENIFKDIKARGISTVRLEIMEGRTYA